MDDLNLLGFINSVLLVPIYFVLSGLKRDIDQQRKDIHNLVQTNSYLRGKLDAMTGASKQ
jgi:Kef-type K+ transport system membrane component KefB